MTMVPPLKSHMEESSSLLAKDKTTGKILAMRIGKVAVNTQTELNRMDDS